MRRISLIIIACTCFFSYSHAQSLGLRSSKTKLLQIDTDTVRVIYAVGQEEKAQRVANVVHLMAKEHSFKGTDKLRKISILLQNETDIPNGYVGLGPWKSEFYTSPPVSNFRLGSLPWTDLLAIHEFRHVQQRSAARQGLSGFAYYLFGEEFFSAMVNISWPNWYTEGDAVIAETALSSQGRGRLPSFMNGYREKILSGDSWSYEKARNGSYKDFVPDHYQLGFLVQNYGREEFGTDFWDKVAMESVRYKGVIYPFSKAVNSASGESTRKFYHSALQYYNDLWSNLDKIEVSISNSVVDVKHGRFEDYSYPIYSELGSLYTVVQSYDHIPAIYEIDTKTGEKAFITHPGAMGEPVIGVGGGKICWAEYRLNSRWARQDYSTIIVFDVENKKKHRLTKNQSYFAPALSQDGSRIVALYDNDLQHYSLHILDSNSGDILDSLPNPENYYCSFPIWSTDESQVITALRDSSGRMAIGQQSIIDGNLEILTPWTFRPIGKPSIHEDWVYYTTSIDAIDQLHRVNMQTKNAQRVTNGLHSKYQPVINPANGDLIYAEFTSDGNRLRSINSNDLMSIDSDQEELRASYLHEEEGGVDILSNTPNVQFETKEYSTFAHPVNFHSWRPVFDDPVYGLELKSMNVLQTISWNTGVQWNANSNDIGPYTELTLGMWYPEIVLGYSGWTRNATRSSDQMEFNWYENTLKAGLRIPFKGRHGPYNVTGAISSNINYLFTSGDVEYTLNYLSQRFNFAHRLNQSRKQPITRFGQAIEITFPHSISADTASQFQVQTDFTLPSFRNHVFHFQFDYRRELMSNTYQFGDRFQYARGYDPYQSDWVYRIGLNYHMPIAYPDVGFGGLLYFKRIRTNLFTDLSTFSGETATTTMNSFGVELIFDIQILNVELISLGVRWSHRLHDNYGDLKDQNRNRFGIFIPLSRI